MKQKIYKVLSLMLAVILLLSSIVGIEVAANTVIHEVDLLNVPSPTVGAAATDYTYTYSESGTEVYTATGEWHVFNHDTLSYDSLPSTDTFVANKSYYLQVTVTPATGYAFEDYNCTFNIDGEYHSNSNSNSYNNKGYAYLYFPGGTPIGTVSIDSDLFPKPEIGKAFDDTDDIKITLPVGTNYIVSGYWHDEDNNTSGTFENGKIYHFVYTTAPKEGYCFDQNSRFYIGGEDYGFPASTGEQSITYNHRVSFKTVIDTIDLSNVPTAEVGKTLKASLDIKLPDDAKYIVSSAWWNDTTIGTTISTVTIAQKNKVYDLNFYIIPKPGYEFAEYVILKLNGASHRVHTDYDSIRYSREYDLRETIDRIEVTGVTNPTAGATATTDSLKVADPDKYEITSAIWLDIASGATPVTKFEDGHHYILDIQVTAKGNYWIAPRATLLLDGEESSSADNMEKTAYLYAEFKLMKVLDEVRVENVPEFKIGASTPTGGIVTDLKVPDGANYSIGNAQWFILENGSFNMFSGVFQKGKYYCLSINIEGKNGYTTDDEKTVFYTNGNKVPQNRIASFWMSTDIRLYFGEDVKYIDRVELTIEKPVTGDHSSMLPVITVKSDANYSVDNNSSWIIGKKNDWSLFNGYFSKYGGTGVNIYLIAKEGYVFSEDLKVIINGKALSADDFDHGFVNTSIPYFFKEECAHYYTDANDETCDACGAKREIPKSPKTGDNTIVLLLTAIIASGAVMIISKPQKTKI